MTARAAALPVLVLAAACIVVWQVMEVSVLAGWLTAIAAAALMFVPAVRLLGGAKGAHAAPRRYVIDLEEATIPRAATRNAPPWEDEPVIEPAAFLAAPVAEPPPDAIIIATAVRTDGQVHSVRTAVLPPVLPGELIPPVAALLGYPSVDAAMDALCAGLHSWESNFTKGDTRLVRALTDGAP